MNRNTSVGGSSVPGVGGAGGLVGGLTAPSSGKKDMSDSFCARPGVPPRHDPPAAGVEVAVLAACALVSVVEER